MSLTQILALLDGKKAILVGIITTTSAFMALKGVIDIDTATYINTIVTILFGGAEVATPKYLGTRRF